MFKRDTCPKCSKKSSVKSSFCPHCGHKKSIKKQPEDWGLLGKKEEQKSEKIDLGLPFGFNTMFNTLLKQMTKEMENRRAQQQQQNQPGMPKNGISISISSKQGQPPEIRINNQGMAQEETDLEEEEQQEIIEKHFSKESLKKFS